MLVFRAVLIVALSVVLVFLLGAILGPSISESVLSFIILNAVSVILYSTFESKDVGGKDTVEIIGLGVACILLAVNIFKPLPINAFSHSTIMLSAVYFIACLFFNKLARVRPLIL